MAEKKSQLERFKEAARELGTDDDEARFNEKLGKIVKQPLTSPDGEAKELDEEFFKNAKPGKPKR